MSKAGLKVAIEFGAGLKSFKDISEAEEYYFSYIDALLECFSQICNDENDFFEMDFSVDSLKTIEKWYFHLCENNGFATLDVIQEDFEKMMGVYYGEVARKNNEDVKWIVEEYPFVEKKYELLINKGLLSVNVLNICNDLDNRPSNKRRNFLAREYKHYFM